MRDSHRKWCPQWDAEHYRILFPTPPPPEERREIEVLVDYVNEIVRSRVQKARLLSRLKCGVVRKVSLEKGGLRPPEGTHQGG